MKIYNHIKVQTPRYDKISKVPQISALKFHGALERFFGQRITLRNYYIIRAQYGNTCYLTYDFKTQQYEVDHFYFSQPKKKVA